MAQKGVNTIVLETKNNILEVVNNGLKQGLPISVISIIVEGIMFEIEKNLNSTLANEDKEYQERIRIEGEQIVYTESPQEEFN